MMSLRSSLVKAQNLSKNLFLSRSMVTVSATAHAKKDGSPEDAKTHTGQAFEKDDYRLIRFTDKPKQVNSQFAIDLIAKTPPADTEKRVVWCDGGGGPTGHPRVYINVDQPGNHSCGYCGLRFYKDDHHH